MDQLQEVFDNKQKQVDKQKSDLKMTSRGGQNWGDKSIGSKNPYSR